MKRVIGMILVAAAIGLTGCSRAPSCDDLTTDIQEQQKEVAALEYMSTLPTGELGPDFWDLLGEARAKLDALTQQRADRC